VGSNHYDAHPASSTLHTGKPFSAPLNICRVVLLLQRQRRGAAGNGLGNTIKYL
jgi:hypothetical protein